MSYCASHVFENFGLMSADAYHFNVCKNVISIPDKFLNKV